MKEKAMTIIEHLEELRKVIIISFLSLIPTSVVGWLLRERTLAILLKPATDRHVKLVYLTPMEPFFVMMKVAIISGVILATPIILWQVWSFILPALRSHEKRMLVAIVPFSVLLFVVGVVFGYLTVFKFGMNFFINFASSQIIALTPTFKLSDYLSFAISFLLPFGVIFEMPLVVLVLAKIGIVNSRFLAKKRKYAILIIFIIAAIVTPTPDVFTQTFVAGPMYILYEVSILIAYVVGRNKRKRAQLEEAEDEDMAAAELSSAEDDS